TQFWSVAEEAGPLRSGTYPTITRPWLHWPAVRECSLGRARLLLVGLSGISRSAVGPDRHFLDVRFPAAVGVKADSLRSVPSVTSPLPAAPEAARLTSQEASSSGCCINLSTLGHLFASAISPERAPAMCGIGRAHPSLWYNPG